MRRRELLFTLPALLLSPRVFAQGTAPLRTRGMNHVGLAVSDVKRSVDFYQGLFGMPVISRQGPTVNLQIGPGPQFLSISPASGAAPSITRLALAVEDFSVDRVTAALMAHGVSMADASAGPGLGGALKMQVRKRGPEAGGAREGTPEFFFTDSDGVLIQLQDPKYCGGGGVLGNVAAPEPSPKKGALALHDWSHATIFGADATRANNFYRDVFGAKPLAYQGTAPAMGIGGVEFLMIAGGVGGGRGRGGPAAAPAGNINHVCMNMENFQLDAVRKGLESQGIKDNGNTAANGKPLLHYTSLRMENRGGAKEGTAELYFTDPDGLLMQLQDTKYCGGAGLLGEICQA
jgi:catechol 2,3-dioxygenase-like lactoylglutathione lyase family enzyme